MSRKGRNGRSKKNSSQGAKARVQDASPTPPPAGSSAQAPEPASPASRPPSQPPPRSVTPLAFAATHLEEAKPDGAAAAQAAQGAVPDDDASTPPVEFDHAFFESRSHPSDASHDEVERDPRLALKMSAAAAQRRAQLAKYVKGAVAVASALCLAALVKVAVARSADQAPAARPAMAALVTMPPDTVQTAAPAADPAPTRPAPAETWPTAGETTPPAPPPAPQPAPPPADTAAAAATPQAPPPPDTVAPTAAQPATPAPAVAPAPAPAEAAPAADTASEPDPKAAGKAKGVARAALERGAVAKSIEAGEQSVSLDPTDGEAWLILGAAYQEKGDTKDARRCFKACLDQGKRGPKSECAQMLR